MYNRTRFNAGANVVDAQNVRPGYYLPPDAAAQPWLVLAVDNDAEGRPFARVLDVGFVPCKDMVGFACAAPTDPKDRAMGELLTLRGLPLAGDLYRHYKGGVYEVAGVAVDERTLAGAVAYRPAATHAEFGQALPWIRPINEFLGKVSVPGSGGLGEQRRYELIAKGEDRTSARNLSVPIAEGEDGRAVQLRLLKHAVQDDLMKAGWCPNADGKMVAIEDGRKCLVCGFEVHERTIVAGGN